ncbi:hypothetical protein [Streptomyces sp. SID14515]|uniref:hypothetical protein n=1 Tax=Streptomyces sp. SID14515 TaxID=2706074 RepID=UPI001EF195C0|nr:hypothetical protein [Streptomyces sp. SID14515]
MTHSTSVHLTTVAAEHPYVLERAFNTFDPESVDRLYEADALFVPRPGHLTTGPGRIPAPAGYRPTGTSSRCASRSGWPRAAPMSPAAWRS